MPLRRYRLKNEYGLADPELYMEADKDDPEAILEGVAMAGLVGLLRQLGDFAEFAAEIFHHLHEEVMATAARGHGLLVRVEQLEAEIPSIERALLSQTSHSSLLCKSGSDWHPNIRMEQNLITQGDLPRFIMDSCEECRGPPRLSLLDKFDVAGAGSCLKRYTDPSFFKVDGLEMSENLGENNTRNAKKKGSKWNNRGTPQVLPKGQIRLHDLLQEERAKNNLNIPAPLVKLKGRMSESPYNLKTGGSYLEKCLEIVSTELDVVSETSVSCSTPPVPWNEGSLSLVEEFEISQKIRSSSTSEINDTLLKPSIDKLAEEVNHELSGASMESGSELYEIVSPLQQVNKKGIEVDGERKMEGSTYNGYLSDEVVSDVDDFMDALATIDSDIESDAEFKEKTYKYLHNVDDSSKQQENMFDFPDSQPVGSFSSLEDNGKLSSRVELLELSSEGIESSDSGVGDVHSLSSSRGSGEEEQQPSSSSSRHTDSDPVMLSSDLEESLGEESVPLESAQNYLHLDDQDPDVNSLNPIKTAEIEEPDIDVKDSFHFSFLHMDEIPGSFVEQGERQLESSALHEEEKSGLVVPQSEEEKPQMLVSHSEEQHQLGVSQPEGKFESLSSTEEHSPKSSPVDLNLVICDGVKSTEQSKAMMPVSVACDEDDLDSSKFLVEESHPITQPMPSPYFLVNQEEIKVPSTSSFPSFVLPNSSHSMFIEMPPLPPLPPVQWRIPKVQPTPLPLDINLPTISSQDHNISHHQPNSSSESAKYPTISDMASLNPLIESLEGLAPETTSPSPSPSMFTNPLPEVEDERLNKAPSKKLRRPRNPLIDAVVAVDKTKLRKVTDRNRPPISQKVEKSDSFLEEIRNKSFNLRPTARTRPNIQGPNNTNLRVAAILEKANSIRQAHAGSSDDDDSWSDS